MTGGSGLSAERGEPTGSPRAAAPVERETPRKEPARVAGVPQPHADASSSSSSSWIATVLRQYEGPLTLYVSRITRDLERARDVVQEAFLRLIREDRQSIEPHVAEWLYTVCRNKALDVRRKESRMTGLSEATTAFEASRDPGPDQRLEREESTAKALRHLAKLPENQQECIRLKFQHGLSYKEISGVTKLSVSNVGFLIHTGLKALRKRMGVEPR
jgi:RNA polymerase sigma factor (sigma-70 family)